MMIFQWHSADFSISYVSFATIQQYVPIVLVLLNIYSIMRALYTRVLFPTFGV